MSLKITTTISTVHDSTVIFLPEFGDIEISISDYEVENDGIGSYECHGVGFDPGKDYVTVNSIVIEAVDNKVFDKDEHAAVDKEIQKMWEEGRLKVIVENIPGEDCDLNDYGDEEEIEEEE